MKTVRGIRERHVLLQIPGFIAPPPESLSVLKPQIHMENNKLYACVLVGGDRREKNNPEHPPSPLSLNLRPLKEAAAHLDTAAGSSQQEVKG